MGTDFPAEHQVAVAATGMVAADESRLFRFTIKYSVILMAVMGLLAVVCLRDPAMRRCRHPNNR
jgi:L-lactate permease